MTTAWQAVARRIRRRLMLAREIGAEQSRVPELIHIDELDSCYQLRPHRWLKGGLRCLDIAIRARKASASSETVFLILHLRPGKKRRGPFVRTLAQVGRLLSTESPPEIGWEIAGRSIRVPKENEAATITLVDLPRGDLTVRFSEWRVPEGHRIEWVRSIWLICSSPAVSEP